MTSAQDHLLDLAARIGGALLVLFIGLLVARLAGRAIARFLRRVGADDFGERIGLSAEFGRLGLRIKLSDLVGRIVRFAIAVIVVVAVIDRLGFSGLDQALSAVILFLPKAIVSSGDRPHRRDPGRRIYAPLERLLTQMALPASLARVATGIVIGFSILIALTQIGIPTAIVAAAGGIILAGLVLAVAIAFGLGGRDIARHLTAGRYVTDAFALGDEIEVGGIRGSIVALESMGVVLERSDGTRVRLPNHTLLDGPVAIGAQEASEASARRGLRSPFVARESRWG